MNRAGLASFLRRRWIMLYDYYFLHTMIYVYSRIGQSSFTLIWAVMTGILTGLAIVVIRLIAGSLENYLVFQKHPAVWLPLLLFAPLGGIALSYYIKRSLNHSNSSADMTALIHAIRVKDPKQIKLETLSHILASSLTVGAGASAGLTTSSVLTGASLGGRLGSVLHVSPERVIRLMTCGTAAGIAAIFGSPIAGVLFAVEVLLPQMNIGTLVPVLLSAASATVIAQMALGSQPFFHMPVHEWHVESIPLYIALGIFCAIVGIYMIRVNNSISERIVRQIPNETRRMIFGGLFVSVLIFLLPALAGEGIFFIQQLLQFHTLQGPPVEWLGAAGIPRVWGVVIMAFLLILIKIVATSLTLGCGGSGGFFAPSLFTGALAGFFLERIFHFCGLQKLNDSNFIALGMCGVFTSSFHAPLTGIFLVVEMTGSYSLMIPLIIIGAISYFLTVFFEDSSVYTRDPKAYDSSDVPEDRPGDPETIRGFLDTDFIALGVSDAPDWSALMKSKTDNDFPVLDEKGFLVGILKKDQINPNMVLYEDLSGLAVSPLGIVRTTDSPSLARAAMRVFSLKSLPVISPDGRFAGFVHLNQFS